MQEIVLTSPLDMHLHLREGEMLRTIGGACCAHLSGAVVMPNLNQVIDNASRLRNYRDEIIEVADDSQFEPYMTLFFRHYTKAELEDVRDRIIGIKLYPMGITTGSEQGVTSLKTCRQTFAAMEELAIPLLVHGESHGFVMDREREFLETYQWLVDEYPQLHIVMEHITTADAVDFLDAHPQVSATVTPHHLLITLDDVVGGLMRPHLFCKPIAKRPEDRARLRDAVFGGHPQIMYGSDSAPHPRSHKETCGCAAGIFTAPFGLPLLATIFDEAGALDRLQSFVSDIARQRYGVHPPEKEVHLRKETWKIPAVYGDVVPFMAGSTLQWQITG